MNGIDINWGSAFHIYLWVPLCVASMRLMYHLCYKVTAMPTILWPAVKQEWTKLSTQTYAVITAMMSNTEPLAIQCAFYMPLWQPTHLKQDSWEHIALSSGALSSFWSTCGTHQKIKMTPTFWMFSKMCLQCSCAANQKASSENQSAGLVHTYICKFLQCGAASLTDLMELHMCLPELCLLRQSSTVAETVSVNACHF